MLGFRGKKSHLSFVTASRRQARFSIQTGDAADMRFWIFCSTAKRATRKKLSDSPRQHTPRAAPAPHPPSIRTPKVISKGPGPGGMFLAGETRITHAGTLIDHRKSSPVARGLYDDMGC